MVIAEIEGSDDITRVRNFAWVSYFSAGVTIRF